jgi:chemotaxis protein MotB
MQAEGMRSEQISQVRGFADRRLRVPDHPEDPSNRRISLIVQYQVENDAEVPLPKDITDQNKAAQNPASPDLKPSPVLNTAAPAQNAPAPVQSGPAPAQNTPTAAQSTPVKGK